MGSLTEHFIWRVHLLWTALLSKHPLFGAVVLVACASAVTSASEAEAPRVFENYPVVVTDDGTSFLLSNGYLTATINKKTGDMTSLKVHGVETQGYVSGHHAGYWEQNPGGALRHESRITIDPATNGGARAEVSVKGWSDGVDLNARQVFPVAAAGALNPAVNLPAGVRPNRGVTSSGRIGSRRGSRLLVDMEIRYSLGRGEHGIYTYAVFTHETNYGATEIGESRYGMKLNGSLFDWLSIDSRRNGLMPTGRDWDQGSDLNMKEARRLTSGIKKGEVEHKYDYCADQFDTPVYGWSSSKRHIGVYIVNPSTEYLSSGPDHFELTGHLDDGDGGDPTLLDYWRGSHYGGSVLRIAAGEQWNKVVGPLMVYVNSGPTPNAMFADAQRQARVEAAKWPYKWVAGVDYPQARGRSTVRGKLLLRDPQASGAQLPNLLVGLAYPDQTGGQSSREALATARMTWQNDAKHYEFWVRGSKDGRFTIPNVRPGTYELHAIADGVLGEYAKAEVVVRPGTNLNLGKLEWVPVRYGKQLWQIGIPNRSASEFLRGDDHWHWGEYIQYAVLFPNDVTYTVGKSDFHRDWFIYQVPHDEDPNDRTGRSRGRATTWTVRFNMRAEPATNSRAILRLALSGVGTRSLDIAVNGRHAGTIDGLIYNATINRDGIEGSWLERDFVFDGSLLHAGSNTLSIIVPAGSIMAGVAYDALRLELASASDSIAGTSSAPSN